VTFDKDSHPLTLEKILKGTAIVFAILWLLYGQVIAVWLMFHGPARIMAC